MSSEVEARILKVHLWSGNDDANGKEASPKQEKQQLFLVGSVVNNYWTVTVYCCGGLSTWTGCLILKRAIMGYPMVALIIFAKKKGTFITWTFIQLYPRYLHLSLLS